MYKIQTTLGSLNKKTETKKIMGVTCAILSSIAYGVMPIFAKVLYNSGVNVMSMLSIRYLMASFILILYFYVKKINFLISKQKCIIFFLVATFGFIPTAATLFYSYNYISVGLATTLHFVYPAIVIVLNRIFYKAIIVKTNVVSLFVSLLGVYILIGVKPQAVNLFGVFLALLSGLANAVCIIVMNHGQIKHVNSLVNVFYTCTFSGIIFLLYTGTTGQFIFPVNIYSFSSILGISLLSTIGAITLFVKALKTIGPSSTSILGTFEMVVSIVMGVIIFSEKLTFTMVIGVILMLSSVIIIVKGK